MLCLRGPSQQRGSRDTELERPRDKAHGWSTWSCGSSKARMDAALDNLLRLEMPLLIAGLGVDENRSRVL